MSVDQTVAFLKDESNVIEACVLLREIKVMLDVGAESFHPRIGIKIYRSDAIHGQPYQFTVSHHAHTPSQGAPYLPSRTWAESETAAIRQAISTTASFIKAAIAEGHEPSASWLIPNEDF